MEEIPVFRPSEEEFLDFAAYVEALEELNEDWGIVKVIPPPSWQARKNGDYSKCYDQIIHTPHRQYIERTHTGIFQMVLEELPSMTIRDFKEIATSKEHAPPSKCKETEAMEREYWRSLQIKPPIYGSDSSGSLFQTDAAWNLAKLDTILNKIPFEIPGINTPYLYVGMYKASFAWHKEDKDLYSINYLHFGAPKTWYALKPSQAKRFEQTSKGYLPEQYKACPEYLRHKTTHISPKVIKESGMNVIHAVQEPGEFIITFPAAFHSGFNHGFNAAEAINFASERWIPKGRVAKSCQCREDSVQLDVSLLTGGTDDEEYCYCKKPSYGKMIQCDNCESWYHEDCLKEIEISERKTNLLKLKILKIEEENTKTEESKEENTKTTMKINFNKKFENGSANSDSKKIENGTSTGISDILKGITEKHFSEDDSDMGEEEKSEKQYFETFTETKDESNQFETKGKQDIASSQLSELEIEKEKKRNGAIKIENQSSDQNVSKSDIVKIESDLLKIEKEMKEMEETKKETLDQSNNKTMETGIKIKNSENVNSIFDGTFIFEESDDWICHTCLGKPVPDIFGKEKSITQNKPKRKVIYIEDDFIEEPEIDPEPESNSDSDFDEQEEILRQQEIKKEKEREKELLRMENCASPKIKLKLPTFTNNISIKNEQIMNQPKKIKITQNKTKRQILPKKSSANIESKIRIKPVKNKEEILKNRAIPIDPKAPDPTQKEQALSLVPPAENIFGDAELSEDDNSYEDLPPEPLPDHMKILSDGEDEDDDELIEVNEFEDDELLSQKKKRPRKPQSSDSPKKQKLNSGRAAVAKKRHSLFKNRYKKKAKPVINPFFK